MLGGKKVASEWVNLLEKVPEAKTERYGHFVQKVWVSGGRGFAHGVTVLVKGAKRKLPVEAEVFMEGGIYALTKSIESKVEDKFKEVLLINELIGNLKSINKNMNKNWALTALSTIALQNIIDTKLKEWGIEPKGDFRERAGKLVKEAKKRGIELDYAKMLSFREQRVVAVHAVHEYGIGEKTAYETYEYLLSLLDKLWQSR